MQAFSVLRHIKDRILNLASSFVIDSLYFVAFAFCDVDPGRPRLFKLIGDLLWNRYKASSRIADLDKAILSYDKAATLTADLEPERLTRLGDLGLVLLDRFELTGNLDDIDKACFCLERSQLINRPSTNECPIINSEEHAANPFLLNKLGYALYLRFKRLGNVSDLGTSIDALQKAVDLTPEGHANKYIWLSGLAVTMLSRFQRLDNVSDLDASIDALHKAVDLSPEEHAEKLVWLGILGSALQLRFDRLGNTSDLKASTNAMQKAVELTSNGDTDTLLPLLDDLGKALHLQFQCLGDVSDLKESLDTFQKALDLTPEGDTRRPNRLSSLGTALHSQFKRLGNVSDLEVSIYALGKAVELTPEGDADKHMWRINLCTALRSRFERLGNVSDLHASIDAQRKVVELTSDGDANKHTWLSNLGSGLRFRFQRLADVSDLEESINALRKAVELASKTHGDTPHCLNELGYALESRFQRLGNISDLDASIDAMRKAVQLTPERHIDKPGRLTNLGTCLQSRFERLGNIADLEASIYAQRKAVALTPEGDAGKHIWLSNLGRALGSRFHRLGNISDLEASIDAQRNAVKLTPEGHPDEPMWLNNLGDALELRFHRLGDVSDLKAGINVLEKAVKLTPEEDLDKPIRLNNLGSALQLRFDRLGDVSDLKAAIDAFRKAVELAREGDERKPGWLLSLGYVYFQAMRHLGDDSLLQAGLDAMSASAQSRFGPPSIRLAAARGWSRVSEELNDEQQTLQAYACALPLISQAAWMGLPIEGRHEALVSIGDLVTRAAAAAIRYGQPNLALEWLEQGRSIVWGQTLHLRSPVDTLRERDPGLAERLTEVSRALDANSKDATPSAEDRGRQLRALSLEWDRLLSEVRQIDGFEHFLGPKKVKQLLLAASICPIVILNAHENGCDALVLMAQADDVIHIPLQFTSERAQVLLDSLQTARVGRAAARHTDPDERHIQIKGQDQRNPDERIESLLAELWSVVVKPVLDGLAFSLPEGVEDVLPRICWCPTGPLAFLPIHAAGLYNTEERGTKVYDFVVSSYTPNVTALLQSPTNSTITPRILAVAQAEYAGRHVSGLPETKQEVELIRSRASKHSIDLIVVENAAGTVKHIVEEMTKCSWMHLACHGIQDVQDPTKSAFILADGNLELEEIVKLNLPHAEFAFLSACQTATGDEKLAEEAVHMAAGMMLAGYRSVIATMWSIQDRDGPIVADVVYSELLKDGKADASRAAYALHKAVHRLRSSGSSLLSWIPFVHMGR